MLREVGVNVTITPVDRATYFERMNAGNFELANFLGSTSWSVDFWLGQLYRSNSARNWWGYSSAEFDDLALKISTELDLEQRREYVYQAQRLLAEDLPTMPVGQGPQVFPSKKTLRGFGEHWSFGIPSLEHSWFEV